MNIRQWTREWEKIVPVGLQYDWDNSGLQIGRLEEEITGIVFSLDLNKSAVSGCIESASNLIVTHHPAFFHPVSRLTDREEAEQTIMDCIEQHIAVYSSHTPLDLVDGGVNEVMAEKCGISHRKVLCERDPHLPYARYSQGMGVIGELESPTTLKSYAERLKKEFSAVSVIFYGNPDQKIRRIANVGGSGMSFLKDAVQKNADCLVTADIKYHEALEAIQQGLTLIDLGHFFSEFPVMQRAMEISKSFCPDIRQQVIPGEVRFTRQSI